jgi:hypothetical protein
VAEAIERVYGDSPLQLIPLAYHWGEAGDIHKEADYASAAGQHIYDSSAYQEAVPYLMRALTLAAQIGAAPEQQAFLEQKLAEAKSAMGRLVEGGDHAKRALALLGFPDPGSGMPLMVGLLRQMARQGGIVCEWIACICRQAPRRRPNLNI